MLAPHVVDIAVIISSLSASLCFTFAEAFFSSSSQVVHWSAEIQTKVGRIDSRSLTQLLFLILQNSRKKASEKGETGPGCSSGDIDGSYVEKKGKKRNSGR